MLPLLTHVAFKDKNHRILECRADGYYLLTGGELAHSSEVQPLKVPRDMADAVQREQEYLMTEVFNTPERMEAGLIGVMSRPYKLTSMEVGIWMGWPVVSAKSEVGRDLIIVMDHRLAEFPIGRRFMVNFIESTVTERNEYSGHFSDGVGSFHWSSADVGLHIQLGDLVGKLKKMAKDCKTLIIGGKTYTVDGIYETSYGIIACGAGKDLGNNFMVYEEYLPKSVLGMATESVAGTYGKEIGKVDLAKEFDTKLQDLMDRPGLINFKVYQDSAKRMEDIPMLLPKLSDVGLIQGLQDPHLMGRQHLELFMKRVAERLKELTPKVRVARVIQGQIHLRVESQVTGEVLETLPWPASWGDSVDNQFLVSQGFVVEKGLKTR